MLGPSVITVEPTPGTELFRSRPLSCGDELVVVAGEIEDRSVKRVETPDGHFIDGAEAAGHGHQSSFAPVPKLLVFRSSSRSTTADSGAVSVENREIFCSTPSSKMRNSFRRRSPTRLPRAILHRDRNNNQFDRTRDRRPLIRRGLLSGGPAEAIASALVDACARAAPAALPTRQNGQDARKKQNAIDAAIFPRTKAEWCRSIISCTLASRSWHTPCASQQRDRAS